MVVRILSNQAFHVKNKEKKKKKPEENNDAMTRFHTSK